MMDSFTSGESVSRVILKAKIKAKSYALPLVKQASLSIKSFTCTECDFSTKSMAALKQHVARSHKSHKKRCEICEFESADDEVKSHMKEFHQGHQTIMLQNKDRLKRKKVMFKCEKISVKVGVQKKLNEHMASQHPEETSNSQENKEELFSPEPSPSRKKPTKFVVDEQNVEEAEVQMK